MADLEKKIADFNKKVFCFPFTFNPMNLID